MSAPQVIIKFDDDRRVFEPGETVRVQFVLEPEPADQVEDVQWSAYWRSEGKGDEDGDGLTITPEPADALDPANIGRLKPIAIRLPRSPLSYDGHNIKIRWFVGAVVRLRGGEKIDGELEFQLGDVAPA